MSVFYIQYCGKISPGSDTCPLFTGHFLNKLFQKLCLNAIIFIKDNRRLDKINFLKNQAISSMTAVLAGSTTLHMGIFQSRVKQPFGNFTLKRMQ